MAFNLTRMSIYVLISAIEEDLRSIIKDYLCSSESNSILNQELESRVKARIERDIGVLFSDLELSDFVDYFDLGDTFQTINSNSQSFPEHISKLIKGLTSDFESIIPIRNRTMHIRPLHFNDFSIVTSFCQKLLSENDSMWPSIKETTGRLDKDPSFVLGVEIESLDEETTVNHNLPLPDFDETGLIGRDDEVEQIKKLCLGSFPVISIVGEGGIGKTALALKVAYDLLEDNTSPFDAVVWVSSKTTQITTNEIKEIQGAISDSLGVIQEISDQTIGSGNTQNNIDEIIDYLSTYKIILFIDNLETILDQNIKSFVGALPHGSKIVITSRIGLGAFEYPIKLEGIKESHGSQLLRLLAKIRNVDSLSKLDERVLRSYVKRMHRNPSYIKWFVSSVQTGTAPEVILQNSDLFLEFCMSNVYEFLSEDARTITATMLCAPGLKDLPELAYLNDFDSVRIQKAIQELMSTNMLSQSSKTKGASVKTTFKLSEMATAYLRKHHKPTNSFQLHIRHKRNQLNALFESQRGHNKYSALNIKLRDRNDRVVAKMLYEAQRSIRSGLHDQAYDVLSEAQRLAPDYFEVARITANFHQKSGNLSDAREQYELAITLAPDTPQLHYWFGRYLLKDEENIDEAIEQFEIAQSLDDEGVELCLSLSRAYMFRHDFDDAEKIINKIKNIVNSSGKHNIGVYNDTIVQIKYRRADDLYRSGRHLEALDYLEEMKSTFDNLQNRHKDSHIRKKLTKCELILNKIPTRRDSKLIRRISTLKEWVRNESV